MENETYNHKSYIDIKNEPTDIIKTWYELMDGDMYEMDKKVTNNKRIILVENY